jgi:ATP-dependent DNA helicase RecG
MNHWVETAIQLLTNSLNPVPQELNEIDWKCGLSDKSERLAQQMVVIWLLVLTMTEHQIH